MTTIDLALDSFISSSAGPVLCEELTAGAEVVVVGRDGRLRSDEVQGIDHIGEQEVAQMLTSVGDIKLPLTTSIITRRGLERASDIARADAGTTRVELVRPGDIPSAEGRKRATKADILAALQALDPPVVMIPTIRSDLDDVVTAVEGYLVRSGTHYEVVDSNRWTTFVFERSAAPYRGDLRAQAEVLAAITAWTHEGGPMRARMCDDRLRRRLLAALVACGKAPDVRWVPAYRPAECHVSEQDPWKPFSAVHSVQVRSEPTVRLRISTAGHIVCGLAIVSSAA